MKDKIQKAIIKCDETGSDPVYKDEQRKKFFLEAINMMKKVMISAIAMTMAVSMAACGQNTADSNTASTENTSAQTTTESEDSSAADSGSEQLDGGWETPATPEMTDEAKNALSKATENLDGATYRPVALLGTQVVAGTNYRILCRTAPVVPDAVETYAIVTVYEDLDGNCEIIDVQDSGRDTDIVDDEEMTGGWEQAESPVMTEDEQKVFDKAFGSGNIGFDGGYKISPVAILSYQVVAGENYCFLATNDYDGSYVFAYCYEDLDGNVSDDYTVDFVTKDDGSSDTEAGEQSEGADTVTEKEDVSYKFDADMFAEMAKENDGSFVFSPYSIKDCITLSYDGMSDDAKSALEQEGISGSSVDDMIRFDDTVSGYDCINIANKLYLNKDDADQYNTDLIRKDGEELVQMNSRTADRINKWIEEQTNGRIKDLIDADSITSETAMIPVNALWMKLSWLDEFHEDEIEWKQTGSGSSKYKGFSGIIANTDVAETDNGYVIRLSYSPEFPAESARSDGPLRFSMYIFIDNDDDDGAKICADVTDRNIDFQSLQAEFDSNTGLSDCDEVNLHMPDFHSEYKSDVKETLEQIGLSGIMPAEAYEKIGPMEVSQIMHGAYINTDENGTEAAAATAEILAGATAMEESPVIKDLYVDHPFAYVIKEDTNDASDGQILFEGIVMSDALQED